MKPKLPLEIFGLPIEEIARGYNSDVYFWRAKRILENEKRNPKCLMQIFQKNKAVLCGVDEAIAILRVGTGYYSNPERAFKLFDELIKLKAKIRRVRVSESRARLLAVTEERYLIEEELNHLWEDKFETLKIMSLEDGNEISPWETVMTIEGPYQYFAHLETVYLGVLARRTRVATNTKKVVEAANGKPILFFPARFDHFSVQTGDGYAAFISGALGVSTDAQAEWWGVKGLGTIPHALIAAYRGDTAKATVAFARNYPDVDTISLVDFENDCVKTSLEVARAMKKEELKLWGVRLDTSGSIVDKSVVPLMGQFKPTGVCEELVWNVRRAFDKEGFRDVKIIVSGGFNPDKIKEFEEASVPVDGYGVGSSLFVGNFDFTADIVRVSGKPCAKVGRKYNPNPRLTLVEV